MSIKGLNVENSASCEILSNSPSVQQLRIRADTCVGTPISTDAPSISLPSVQGQNPQQERPLTAAFIGAGAGGLSRCAQKIDTSHFGQKKK